MERHRVLYWIDQRGVCDGGDYPSLEKATRVGAAVLTRRDVERVEIVAVEATMEPPRRGLDVWA